MFGRDVSIPPGLMNYHQENLCFINCILQTLCRSPQLRENLESAPVPDLSLFVPSTRLTFLREVVSMFRKLTVPDMETALGEFCYHDAKLDSTSLRRAISAVCALHLVESPSSGNRQPQQDASEFLLWFLDTLHNTLRMPVATGTASIYARPGKLISSNRTL